MFSRMTSLQSLIHFMLNYPLLNYFQIIIQDFQIIIDTILLFFYYVQCILLTFNHKNLFSELHFLDYILL